MFKNVSWTKTALSRLSKFLTKVSYRRGNAIYKKGDDCKYIYFVYEGEFELIKTVKLKQQGNDIDHKNKSIYDQFVKTKKRTQSTSPFLMPLKPIKDPAKGFVKKSQNYYSIPFKNLCKGNIISEDAVGNFVHSKTLRCKSLNGVLLHMNVSALKHIKDHPETWEYIKFTN